MCEQRTTQALIKEIVGSPMSHYLQNSVVNQQLRTSNLDIICGGIGGVAGESPARRGCQWNEASDASFACRGKAFPHQKFSILIFPSHIWSHLYGRIPYLLEKISYASIRFLSTITPSYQHAYDAHPRPRIRPLKTGRLKKPNLLNL